MIQEEKQILLIDLYARAPYKVHCRVFNLNGSIKENDDVLYGVIGDNVMTLKSDKDECLMYYQIKPYLRSMFSMTEEEKMEFTKLFDKWHDDELFDYIEEGVDFSIWKHKGISAVVFDWLNKKMFDYRGLIPRGLALEASKDMYAIKN